MSYNEASLQLMRCVNTEVCSRQRGFWPCCLKLGLIIWNCSLKVKNVIKDNNCPKQCFFGLALSIDPKYHAYKHIWYSQKIFLVVLFQLASVRSTCSLVSFGDFSDVFCSPHFIIFNPTTPWTFPGRPWGEKTRKLATCGWPPLNPCALRSNYSFLCETCCSAGRLCALQLHPLLAACSFCPLFGHFCVPRLGYIMCAHFVLGCHSVLKRRIELWLCPACNFWSLPSDYLTLDCTMVLLNFGLVIFLWTGDLILLEGTGGDR
jgi:hypothetical protein